MKKLIIPAFLVVALSTVAFASWLPTGSKLETSPGIERPANCCCIVTKGQLICTLTGEVLEECCCK